MRQIFVVEDDDNIREIVAYTLNSAGFSVKEFPDASAFAIALESETPQLVILDIMLPGEDGISVLRKLKQSAATKSVPVIMLTARGAELDRVRGLDLGADDYITKPFSVIELIARVKAVLRRCSSDEGDETLVAGEISLFPDRHMVLVGETEIPLTFKEFALLEYLMRNAGIALTRDRLLEAVWGWDFTGETRTVDMHIKTLRTKLGDSGRLIATVRNVGYRMEGSL